MIDRASRFIRKVAKFYRENGLRATIRTSYNVTFKSDPLTKMVRKSRGKDLDAIFLHIYNSNLWKDDESRSGISSSISNTENIRREIPKIVEKFSLKSILDAPCGDFNWMKEVAFPEGFHYIGADIVAPLIDSNRKSYEVPGKRTFLVADITRDPLPEADLFFCRDCLFHLSSADINKVFDNFLASGIKYIMTSTHINHGEFVNAEIYSGNFRRIDLFAPPYNLPADVLARVEDYHEGFVPREMCLWSREQIARARGR